MTNRNGTEKGSLRLRKHKQPESLQNSASKETLKPLPQKRKSTPSSFTQFLIFLFCISLPVTFSYVVALISKRRLPQIPAENATGLTPFEGARAMHHINQIGEKPKFVSSAALEQSLQYIFSEVSNLESIAAKHGMQMEIDRFTSHASTFETSIGPINLINSYDQIHSVVVRISPQTYQSNHQNDTLLINAHVDSAIASPGASDDIVGVAIILEILRCIATKSDRTSSIKRPLIFLFNGGEEVVLHGSHSFITQHPWAGSIAAHINMESIGSGDTLHLFRLGPGSSWLAEAYAASVSVPSGSVCATDFFNAKLIPAETDFRIFDEVGGIPGYDLVLLDNGYIYHTIYDSVENVNEVGVYHGGDLVHQLVMELAGPNDAIGSHIDPHRRNRCTVCEALRQISAYFGLIKDPHNPRVTFFDLFQFHTIVYEEGPAVLFNLCVLLSTCFIWVFKIGKMKKKERLGMMRMFAVAAAGVFGALASSVFASYVYAELLGAKLRWYGNWMTAVLMYGPPGAFGIASALLLTLPRHLSSSRFEQMLFVVSLFYGVLSALFTWFGLMSSYIPIALLFVLGICALQRPYVNPALLHVEIVLVHAILQSKVNASSLSSVLPLLGRVRSSLVPHDTIAALVVTGVCLLHGALSSLPILVHCAYHLRSLRSTLFTISFGIAAYLVWLSPLLTGKPSQFTYDTHAPKRISAIHFFSPQQDPPSVLWLSSQDAVPLDSSRILSNLASSSEDFSTLPTVPTWGALRSTAIETFRPFGVFMQDTVLVRTSAKPILPLPTAKVSLEEELGDAWNVSVRVKAEGSHLLSVRLDTSSPNTVMDWSLNAEIPRHEDGAWVKHTGTSEFQFWILVHKSSSSEKKRPHIRMAITSGRLGFSRSPVVLEKLLFKTWEAPAVAVSSGVEVLL